jgi:hypothetical protein
MAEDTSDIKTLQPAYVFKMFAAIFIIGLIPGIIDAATNRAVDRPIYQDNSTSGGWPIPPSS